MTNTQHTPGPWAICPRGRPFSTARLPILSEPDADGYWLTIADVFTIGPQGDADARLIAAAPDLLDALQAVADYWAGGDVPADIDAAMRAAIAKATGQ